MKKLYFLIAFGLMFASCNEQPNANTVPEENTILLTQRMMELPAIGNELNVELRRNLDIEVIVPDTVEWVTFHPTKAITTQYLSFAIAPNTSNTKRTAQITIKQIGGALSEVLTIQQKGRDTLPTSSEINPTIAAMTAVEKETATTLKLTGMVTREDFEAMKYMPNLKVIDLSGAKLPNNQIPSAIFKANDNGTNKCFQEIIFPSDIKSIGGDAFASDSFFSTLAKIPNLHNIERIEAGAFSYCFSSRDPITTEQPQSLTLPNSLISIGEYAFNRCGAIAGEVVIPSSVKYIGKGAFYTYSPIESFKVSWDVPIEYTERMLKRVPVYVPMASVDLYKSTEGWKDHEIRGY